MTPQTRLNDPADEPLDLVLLEHRPNELRRVSARLIGWLLLAVSACADSAVAADRGLYGEATFRGMCDASAAVAIFPDVFVAASDEGAALRVYRQGRELPLLEFDLTNFLKLEADDPEADIEGAAWLGDRIYWIGSHSRNSKGEKCPDRRRLFATKTKSVGGDIHLETVGEPYRHLLRDMKNDPNLARFDLDAAAELPAEAPNGLNIEGLAATPEGNLLIGFRNPIPDKKALLIPLKNPHKVLDGADAKLGDPILLDLGGRGIRSLEYWPDQRTYLIVAGPFDDHGSFRLYQWSGNPDDVPKAVDGLQFGELHPEALFVRDNTAREIQILSDDGDRRIEPSDKRCKKSDPADQICRSVRLKWNP